MAQDLTSGLNIWVRYVPDFEGNRKAKKNDKVSMEIRILNHKMLKVWRTGLRIAEKEDDYDDLEYDDNLIREHLRNIENLVHGKGKNQIKILTAEQLIEYAPTWLITMIKLRMLTAKVLTKEEVKN